MRLVTKAVAALVVVTASGGIGLGASNCGFLTIEQCRATLTGGSSFCVQSCSRQDGPEVRVYAMPVWQFACVIVALQHSPTNKYFWLRRITVRCYENCRCARRR